MREINKTMRKITLFIAMVGLLTGTFSPMALSQQPTKLSLTTQAVPVETKTSLVTGNTFQYTLSFKAQDLHFEKSLGYDLVTMSDCSYLDQIGNPSLPVKQVMIALPSGMRATAIRVLSAQEQPLPGTYSILPVQRPQPVGGSPALSPNAIRNKATYTSFLPFPPQLISLGKETDLAGQAMIPVTIFPLHYLPVQKKLSLIQSISFVIEGVPGYVCGDYLPQSFSENKRMTYEQMVKGMVINPDDVALQTSQNPQPLGVSPGDYDYVIVTQDSWVSAFQPLADWKTQKGVPATIVTTNWIYNNGGYSGTDVQKIKAFVQDVYNTWGTTYVLLGGDVDVVPCSYKTFPGVDYDPVPNDAYYADFDGDYICEVNIGRASVTGTGNGTGQIGNFIYKVLTYETNPPLTNYAKKIGLFGFDLDSYTHAQQCKININTSYIPTSWTVKTVYDSQGGNHQTNVINALNAGQNIVNHADHSGSDAMGTGYVNHGWLIYNSDMDSLTNGNKQTILYSMGCDPAAYDVNECIAEHFVQNSNGGGIAFIGNSRYGWYNYGTYDTLSMGYDVHFFKSLFQEGLYNLGVAFSDHKNDGYQDYPGDEYYQYIFTELTLLGDPELPIWTENPTSLTVSHPGALPVGTSSFYVTVSSGGSPLNQAYVCLWKGTEVYQRGYTDATGNVSFTVSPTTAGTMNITVTKHNYIPNISTAQVTGDNLPPYQPSAPYPADGATGASLTVDLTWTGGDPNQGDIVTYDVYFGTSSNPPRVVNNQSGTTYDPGTLAYVTTYHWKIVAWDNHGASTAGPAWSFTTKANTPPVYGNPSPANGSTGNPLHFTWSIPISDPDGDSFSWAIQCSNGQANSGTGASNGTKSLTLSGLAYATTYKVWVNATDPGGSGTYTRKWYIFTTKVNQPPAYGMPTPANGSTGNPLSFTWSIPINDPEGDLFSWTIHCSNGQMSSGTNEANGTKALALSGLAYSVVYTVWVNATDPSGSGVYTRRWYIFDTLLDSTPPTTVITMNGTLGKHGWYIGPVVVTLTATDGQSGVLYTMYKIDSGTWTTYTSPFTIADDGSHTISCYSVDIVGNAETPNNAPCKIDQTKPSITLTKQQIDPTDVTFTAQVSDATSGIDRVEFYLNGQLQFNDTQAPYTWTWTGYQNDLVLALVYDLAGNSQSQSMHTSTSLQYGMSSDQLQFQSLPLKQQRLQ
jgi:hypothetical protein